MNYTIYQCIQVVNGPIFFTYYEKYLAPLDCAKKLAKFSPIEIHAKEERVKSLNCTNPLFYAQG